MMGVAEEELRIDIINTFAVIDLGRIQGCPEEVYNNLLFMEMFNKIRN
jgi:hypothetical protein